MADKKVTEQYSLTVSANGHEFKITAYDTEGGGGYIEIDFPADFPDNLKKRVKDAFSSQDGVKATFESPGIKRTIQ